MGGHTEISKRIRWATLGTLVALLAPALAAAQELPRRLYSAPIGLTQADALRVVIATAPIRIQGTKRFCDADVTVEVLDALDMSAQAIYGPTRILVANGFQADFTAAVGSPPGRREVVVRTTIERKPRRAVERGTLAEICPLVGSIQVFDIETGRNVAGLSHLLDATTQNPEFVPDVSG